MIKLTWLEIVAALVVAIFLYDPSLLYVEKETAANVFVVLLIVAAACLVVVPFLYYEVYKKRVDR